MHTGNKLNGTEGTRLLWK